MPFAHGEKGVDGAHPKGQRLAHTPARKRIGRGSVHRPFFGRAHDGALPVHRFAQTVEHAPQDPLAYSHAKRPPGGTDHGVRADACHLPQWHEHHLVAAKADHLCLQARLFSVARPRNRVSIDVDQFAHAHTGNGGAHHQASHLRHPAGQPPRIDLVQCIERIAKLDQRGVDV